MTTMQATGANLLTHSRMACAKTCLRRHYYLYELGIRRDRDSQPLRMGAAFHLGLDMLAKGAALNVAIDAAVAGYTEVPAWCISDDDMQDWLIEREIVARLLQGYAHRWTDGVLNIIASEVAFDVPIRNPETGASTPSFRLAGKIDKIVELPDGRQAVMEHKTSGEDLTADSDYWKRLRIDQQISAYMIGAAESGYKVETVIYDVTRKPLIRPRKVTKAEATLLSGTHQWFGSAIGIDSIDLERETVAMYGARLAADITERPDWYFGRMEIPRLRQNLDEFRWELWQLQGMLRDCQRLGRWPRNTAACLHPYKCPMWELCVNGWDTSTGEVPPGFVRVENVNPELSNE